MIVCSFKNDIYTQGISAALTSVYGEDFKLWQVEKKPIFDVIDELSPDLILLHEEYQQLENTLKPLDCKSFILQSNLELANVVHYHKGKKRDNFKTEVIYWSRVTSTPELIKTLWQISEHFTLKVFGPFRIDMPYYLGNLNFSDTADALASSKLNLDFNNYSRYDAILNGTYSIIWSPEINIIDEINLHLNNEFPIEKLKDEVWNKYTFHHEIYSIINDNNILKDLDKYK